MQLNNTRAQLVQSPLTVKLPCCIISGPWWLCSWHCGAMKAYGGCVVGIVSLSLRILSCQRHRKLPLQEVGVTLKDHTAPSGQDIS